MFGMGGTEIIVILIVALIFLGPDKLPEAAKSISKGIRDLKRSTRDIQETFEADEQFGGALRDIKSALRGEDAPVRPKKNLAQASAIAVANGVTSDVDDDDDDEVVASGAVVGDEVDLGVAVAANTADTLPVTQPEPAAAGAISLPEVVGEAAAASTLSATTDEDRAADAAVAALIRPASGSIAKGSMLSGPTVERTSEGSERGPTVERTSEGSERGPTGSLAPSRSVDDQVKKA